MSKRKMSLKDACALVPDDLPDGAFFAMAHEFAGAEYGEAWDELEDGGADELSLPNYYCDQCPRVFHTKGARRQHKRDKHKVQS